MAESRYTTEKQIEQMRRELEEAKKWNAADKKGKLSGRAGRLFLPSEKLLRRLPFWLLTAALVYILSSVLIARSKGEIPDLFGYQLYVVESGSMSPTLRVGSVILSKKPGNAGALNTTDIVTFRRGDGSIITHRIVEVLRDEKGRVRYRTKGDNPLNSPDPELLEPERVIAVLVARIPLT